MKTLSLFLSIGLLSVTHAAPILYNINFTLTSGPIIPGSGSFTFDTATNLFTTFNIEWSGSNYDLLTEVNGIVLSPGPCRTAAPAQRDYFEGLIGNCNSGIPLQWAGSGIPIEEQSFSLSDFAGGYPFGTPRVTGPFYGGLDDISSRGTLTAAPARAQAPIPEPASMLLVSVGGILLALRTRRIRRKPSDQPMR